MKSNFITIHLDRLKYSDIDLLYRAIQDIILQLDAESLHLTVAFTRYCNQTEKLTGLEYKVRTKLFRENYANELKRLDELVSALLLHLKALKRADFPEFRFEVESINKFMRKELGNFVHVGADNKKNALGNNPDLRDDIDDEMFQKILREEFIEREKQIEEALFADKDVENLVFTDEEVKDSYQELLREQKRQRQADERRERNFFGTTQRPGTSRNARQSLSSSSLCSPIVVNDFRCMSERRHFHLVRKCGRW